MSGPGVLTSIYPATQDGRYERVARDAAFLRIQARFFLDEPGVYELCLKGRNPLPELLKAQVLATESGRGARLSKDIAVPSVQDSRIILEVKPEDFPPNDKLGVDISLFAANDEKVRKVADGCAMSVYPWKLFATPVQDAATPACIQSPSACSPMNSLQHFAQMQNEFTGAGLFWPGAAGRVQ